jgi:hypothetical protein
MDKKMTKDEALKLGLQLVETAEYLATDSAVCGNYVKEERALIQQSKIAFEKALAQPEQEPVAWRSWNEKDGFGFWDTKHEAESWCDPDFDSEPLYTTPPPQREWVGLTEEEKHDCYLRIDIWSRCYEMVEAKLREKNGG